MWKWTKSLQKLWALGGCVTVPGPGTHPGDPESFPEIVLHIHLHICCLGWTCVLGFSVSLLICISCLSINYQSGWILWDLASMCKSSILDFSTSSFNVTFIWNKITGWWISNSLLCGRVLGGLSMCFLWLAFPWLIDTSTPGCDRHPSPLVPMKSDGHSNAAHAHSALSTFNILLLNWHAILLSFILNIAVIF